MREKERQRRTLRRGGREREKGADKKKRSSKLTAASGRPRRGATGSPLGPKTLSFVLLGLAAIPTAALSPVSLFPLSPPSLSFSPFLFLSLPLFAFPRAVLPCHDPYPTDLSLAPLEARQMSGIRLRHLSVSSSVTFDSRQIERRACQEREEERKRRAAFYRWAR